MQQNFILDFTHVYPEGMEEELGRISRIDCSDIPECNLYCSLTAEQEIRKRIEPYGVSGIHFLDSGNYHYMTKLMLERIQVPFGLVVFDNHTDMQEPQAEGLTSCGGWLRDTLDSNPFLKQVMLLGPEEECLQADHAENFSMLISYSRERLQQKVTWEELERTADQLPFYLSIDKDVLTPANARTNWNQGEMTTEELEYYLDFFLHKRKIIGVDICGENPQATPFSEYLEAQRVNHKINLELYTFLNKESFTYPVY